MLAKIEPLPGADAQRTQVFIHKVITSHPQDYASLDGWQGSARWKLRETVTVVNRHGFWMERAWGEARGYDGG